MTEIAISGLPLDYPNSGTAVYTQSLLRLLPQIAPDLSFRLFTRRQKSLFSGTSVDRLSSPLGLLNRGSGVAAQLDKLLWEIGSLPAAALMRHAALIHSPTFAAPVIAPCPLVVTVHDLIPLILPDYHRTPRSVYYSRLMESTVRRANAIITVSEHARSDIVRILRVPESNVFVTYEGTDDRFSPVGSDGEKKTVAQRYGLPERFVLYLGGAERRKNLETLVRAWALRVAQLRSQDVKLVIVADIPAPDVLYPDIRGLVSELGLASDVLLLPQVDEECKPALYRAAEVFCFPSRYEGFGLPPLEAMACGVPIVCSDSTSLPEVTGDAAWLLSPDDVGAWANTLVEVIASSGARDEMRRRGLERAVRFSWHRTAQQTVDVYRLVLGG